MKVVGLAVLCAACSFDASGVGGGSPGSADGSITGGGTDATAYLPPDARLPGPPDAAPPPPPGRVRCAPLEGRSLSLDGDLSDWAGAEVIPFDVADSPHRDFVASGYHDSASLTLRALCDADSIYLGILVTDDVAGNDSSPIYQDDAVAIYLDAGGDRSGPYGWDDHEILIGSDGYWDDYAGGSQPGLVGAVEPAGEGASWVIEVQISKWSLGAGTLPSEVGFDVAIVDDDRLGGADADLFALWYEAPVAHCSWCCSSWPHPEPWCDTTLLGTLDLE